MPTYWPVPYDTLAGRVLVPICQRVGDMPTYELPRMRAMASNFCAQAGNATAGEYRINWVVSVVPDAAMRGLITASVARPDPVRGAEFFGLAFGLIVGGWLAARAIGLVVSGVRRF